MSDMMTFPNTVEEFMENYKIVDSEQIYTNGAEMVPIFRMKQWFEHLPSAQPGWIPKKPVKIERPLDLKHWGQIATKMEYHCPNSICNREVLQFTIFEHGNTKETVVRPYCPFCGQKLDWEGGQDGTEQ